MKKIVLKLMMLGSLAAIVSVACVREREVRPEDPNKDYLEELKKLGDVAWVNLNMGVGADQEADGTRIGQTRFPIGDPALAEDPQSYYNCWVFQFSMPTTGSELNGYLVAPPYYIDDATIAAYKSGTPIKIPMLNTYHIYDMTANGGTGGYFDYPCRIVIVANTNNRAYAWNMTRGKSTYRDLLNQYITLTAENQSYTNNNVRNLLMSWSDVYPYITDAVNHGTDQTMDVAFDRSTAKIELNLSCDPGYTITKIRMRNVSNRLNKVDALLEQASIAGDTIGILPTDIYPTLATPIDYDVFNWSGGVSLVPDDGTVKNFVWYVSHNARGVKSNTVASLRNIYAPTEASYFEIWATAPGNVGVVYTIYPGANISTYDLLPNRRYVTNIHIDGDGSGKPLDSRIQRFDPIWFDGYNNSFILNPPTVGEREYYIPVSQVNRYWGQVSDAYGNSNQGPITMSAKWQADILWQDAANLVRLQDSIFAHPEWTAPYIQFAHNIGYGVYAPSSSDELNHGSHNPEGYFKIVVPAGAPEGNFVVCLRTDIGGLSNVFWSWHFWVTDYNPNFVFDKQMYNAIDGHQFTYPVPNGRVERYGGTSWGYSGNAAGDWSGYTLTGLTDTINAPYSKSFMMDRNLGSLSGVAYANDKNGFYYSATNIRGLMYYQWGRKDPFPAAVNLYDVNGVQLSTSNSTGPASFIAQHWASSNANAQTASGLMFQSSIFNPMTFYMSGGDWSGLPAAATSNQKWNDTFLLPIYTMMKSIFDPCPPGWYVPESTVWADWREEYPASGATFTKLNSTISRSKSIWETRMSQLRPGLQFGSWGNGNRVKYWPMIPNVRGEYPVPSVANIITYPTNGYRAGTGQTINGCIYGIGDKGVTNGSGVSNPNENSYNSTWNWMTSVTSTAATTSQVFRWGWQNAAAFNVQTIYKSQGLPVRCISISPH